MGMCRNLYNSALQERRDFYKKYNKSRSYIDQAKFLCEIKEILPEYKNIHSQILQDILKRLDKSFQGFFRRLKSGEKPGFPRFLSKDRYNSFCFPQSGFKIVNNRLNLSKIGSIKINLHRELIGKIKTCTIIVNNLGEWSACFSTEVEKQAMIKTNKSVGIDLGITNYLTKSDGETIAPSKYIDKYLNQLKLLSKRYSKNKTSAKRKRLARLHKKIVNSRVDWQHKVANQLIKENDVIILEDLNVRNMVDKNKSNTMKRHIYDASWSRLTEYITYKAEYADKRVVLVNPMNTSKMCSCCKNIKTDLKLYDRIYHCESCKATLDRDYNASLNILNLGLEVLRTSNPGENRDVFSEFSRCPRL